MRLRKKFSSFGEGERCIYRITPYTKDNKIVSDKTKILFTKENVSICIQFLIGIKFGRSIESMLINRNRLCNSNVLY